MGVTPMMPLLDPTAPLIEIRAFEDSLDAVVCAWAGVFALAGVAVLFGDQDSAIWIPAPGSSIRKPAASAATD